MDYRCLHQIPNGFGSYQPSCLTRRLQHARMISALWCGPDVTANKGLLFRLCLCLKRDGGGFFPWTYDILSAPILPDVNP